MQKQIVWSATLIIVLASSAAQGQEKRAELGFNLGYTGSEGVTATDVVSGARFDAGIDPKSFFSWNFDFGYFATEKVEVGRACTFSAASGLPRIPARIFRGPTDCRSKSAGRASSPAPGEPA
jgi:hypothetical protein